MPCGNQSVSDLLALDLTKNEVPQSLHKREGNPYSLPLFLFLGDPL